MTFPARKFLIALVCFVAFLPIKSIGQDLTGIWRGIFITDDGDEYRCEIQIGVKSKTVSGVSYSYLDTRFYGKASLTGLFNKAARSVMIQEIKTIELKMSGGSVACIMKYMMDYSKSGNEEFLEGTFTSSYEKGFRKGEFAGGGKVMLRRVTNSDFYVEPFLRRPEIKKDTATKKPVTKPVTRPQTKPVTEKPVVRITTPATPPKKDTVKRNTAPVIVDKPDVAKPKTIDVPVTTRSRENTLMQTVTVHNEEISIRLYDNGEIDGDTVSVYLDGKVVVSNKLLSTTPITIRVDMSEENPEHVLVMVAENLGRIPPNTSLMMVQDGDKRYQVSITSTEQKNAMVRFRYQKK